MLATGRQRLRRRAPVEPSAYLTDGRRLLRVVKGFGDPEEGGLAVLEDCRTLETLACTPDELYAMGLEIVRAPSRLL